MNDNTSNIFLEHFKHLRKTGDRVAEDVQDLKLRIADIEHNQAYSAVTDARLQSSLDRMAERLDRIERRLEIQE
jgi:hypothetical protein